MAAPRATDDDLWEALGRAHETDVISGMSDVLETVVGESRKPSQSAESRANSSSTTAGSYFVKSGFGGAIGRPTSTGTERHAGVAL